MTPEPTSLPTPQPTPLPTPPPTPLPTSLPTPLPTPEPTPTIYQRDSVFQSSGVAINMTWADFNLHPSGVQLFEAGVCAAPHDVTISLLIYSNCSWLGSKWLVHMNHMGTRTRAEFTGVDLEESLTYWGVVRATSVAGVTGAFIYSSYGLRFDGSPPSSGSVELSPYQRDVGSIRFQWGGFSDGPHGSGIDHFDFSIGTSIGSTQISPLGRLQNTSGPVKVRLLNNNTAHVSKLRLVTGMDYYVCVVAVDAMKQRSDPACSFLRVDASRPRARDLSPVFFSSVRNSAITANSDQPATFVFASLSGIKRHEVCLKHACNASTIIANQTTSGDVNHTTFSGANFQHGSRYVLSAVAVSYARFGQ